MPTHTGTTDEAFEDPEVHNDVERVAIYVDGKKIKDILSTHRDVTVLLEDGDE